MIRVLVAAAGLAALVAVILLQLESTPELIAWELVLLVALLMILRGLPRSAREPMPSLFGDDEGDRPHPPRSVSSFELAAVHAFSETSSADRRLRGIMQRILTHRLASGGDRPEPDSLGQMRRLLWEEPNRPLTQDQMKRIVEQLEDM